MLGHAYHYIEGLKKKSRKKHALINLAGTISDKDAVEMKKIIQKEFSDIEGEW
jgi:lauroyl/myristoyl acyltransferase